VTQQCKADRRACKARFLKAKDTAKTIPNRPSNDDFLFLYRHVKQASGDVSGSRPGMRDMVGRAKYDAWAKLKGMSSDSAMQSYIDKVTALLASHK